MKRSEREHLEMMGIIKPFEYFAHDHCPECGSASIPAEGVQDQQLRGCPVCDHVWQEDMTRPAT